MGAQIPQWEGAILKGQERPIVKYREYRPCAAAVRPLVKLESPHVEAALVVTYFQFPVQVCFSCNASPSPTLLPSRTLVTRGFNNSIDSEIQREKA